MLDKIRGINEHLSMIFCTEDESTIGEYIMYIPTWVGMYEVVS